MTDIVTVTADCEANGHPSECTEPAPGTVDSTSSHAVTITNASGETQEIATEDSADMNFTSHSHDYDSTNGCHDSQSHTLDPNSAGLSSSLTINASPMYLQNTDVASDPGTGGSIDIINGGVNASMSEQS